MAQIIKLEIPIWNKIENDKIKLEAIPADKYFFIKLKINDKQIFSKKFDKYPEFQKIVNEILECFDKITEKHYVGSEEEFQKESDDFFEYIKTI